MISVISAQPGREDSDMFNEPQPLDDCGEDRAPSTARSQGTKLASELRAELADRVSNLKKPTASTVGGMTDQWRIYQEVIAGLSAEIDFLLIAQASAGAGK
eukprot:7993893-Karenia_brevis.AAC.1